MLGRNKKPAVDILEYEKVYDWYDAKKPRPRRTKLGQFLMSKLVRPKYTILPETEAAITQHLNNKGLFIIAANHTEWHDPLVLASLQKKVKALRRTRKNMTGIVKTSLLRDGDFSFSKEGFLSLKYSLLRSAVEAMDSLPMFRPKDFKDKKGNIIDQERYDLIVPANKRAFKSVVTRFSRRKHIGIFPEGQRNEVDPYKIQPFAAALGRIAVDGYEETKGNLMILPISIEPGKDMRGRRAYIGAPISLEGLNKNAINAQTSEALQNGLDFLTNGAYSSSIDVAGSDSLLE